MAKMWERAESRTDHYAPIIIADLASAVELLTIYPDRFVAYVDEPTAGAERGKVNNKVTEYIAKICSLLPSCSVLLSATLPDIVSELPSLAADFTARHPGGEVKMVNSLRLPVGCDALSPDGVHVLPHQLAESWEERHGFMATPVFASSTQPDVPAALAALRARGARRRRSPPVPR